MSIERADAHTTSTRTPQAPPPTPPRLDSRELFGARNVVLIRHAEQDYVLRLTRNGKLILTK